jgi:hypothetical protein
LVDLSNDDVDSIRDCTEKAIEVTRSECSRITLRHSPLVAFHSRACRQVLKNQQTLLEWGNASVHQQAIQECGGTCSSSLQADCVELARSMSTLICCFKLKEGHDKAVGFKLTVRS